MTFKNRDYVPFRIRLDTVTLEYHFSRGSVASGSRLIPLGIELSPAISSAFSMLNNYMKWPLAAKKPTSPDRNS